jgi:hypothetical protein
MNFLRYAAAVTFSESYGAATMAAASAGLPSFIGWRGVKLKPDAKITATVKLYFQQSGLF